MELEAARAILIRHSRLSHPPIAADERHGHFGECRNPLCGDHVQVWLRMDTETILSCRVQPSGCTMCLASASLMAAEVQNRGIESVRKLAKSFEQALLQPPSSEWPSELVRLEAFFHLKTNRARIPCALIPWHALKNALRSASSTRS
jgi:nitrogen fixation NifU-like protein